MVKLGVQVLHYNLCLPISINFSLINKYVMVTQTTFYRVHTVIADDNPTTCGWEDAPD